MSDRPHKWPGNAPDGDIIAWKCAACDQWVSEYGKRRDECPVNWRRRRLRLRKPWKWA